MSKKVLTDLDFGGNKILNADVTETIPFKTAPSVNNKVLTEADAGGGSDSVIFVTTENTYAEVLAYYNAGKEIILVTPSASGEGAATLYMFCVIKHDSGTFTFTCSYNNTPYYFNLSVSGWTGLYPTQSVLAYQNEVWMNDYRRDPASTSETLDAGNFYQLYFNSQTSYSITLSTTGSVNGKTKEWNFACLFGYGGCSLSITPPTGYTIKWGIPLPSTWQADTEYEFSFRCIDTSWGVIVGYWKGTAK